MREKTICFQGNKGSGKTTKLIEVADRYFCYLVVRDRRTVFEIERKARKEGKDIPMPLTYDEFINRKFYGKGILCFVIDDVEALLQYMARGVGVRAFSIDTNTIEIVNLNS